MEKVGETSRLRIHGIARVYLDQRCDGSNLRHGEWGVVMTDRDAAIRAEVRRLIERSLTPKPARPADLMKRDERNPSIGELLKKLVWPRKKP